MAWEGSPSQTDGDPKANIISLTFFVGAGEGLIYGKPFPGPREGKKFGGGVTVNAGSGQRNNIGTSDRSDGSQHHNITIDCSRPHKSVRRKGPSLSANTLTAPLRSTAFPSAKLPEGWSGAPPQLGHRP